MKVSSRMFSSLFYTTDTYGTFSSDYLDDQWFEESEFDHKGFMKDLAESHAHVINSVLPSGPVKSVKVLGTSSPREYNFQTDQVDLEIDVDLPELRKYIKLNEKEFEEYIKENFTSYDGFWSWTPNNLRDFYGAVEMSGKYDKIDRDKCVAIMAGWYLAREELSPEQYMDEMWDIVGEDFQNNFQQFTTETWREYTKYEDEFNRLKESQLEFEGFPPGYKYLMDIEEWYREVKEKEEADVETS